MSDPFAFSEQTTGLLFIAAKEAAKRANKMSGRIGEQTEAMTAVVLAVIVAEAGINDISDRFEVLFTGPPFSIEHGLPHGFEGLELRLKWSLLPMLIRHKTFDRGAEPWQSFHALVELRNAIVHHKNRPLSKAAAGLLDSKDLLMGCNFLSFGVARWACNTMAAMFAKLTELVDAPKEWINFRWLWTPKFFPFGLSTPGDPFEDT